jgi:hypothetical protein
VVGHQDVADQLESETVAHFAKDACCDERLRIFLKLENGQVVKTHENVPWDTEKT